MDDGKGGVAEQVFTLNVGASVAAASVTVQSSASGAPVMNAGASSYVVYRAAPGSSLANVLNTASATETVRVDWGGELTADLLNTRTSYEDEWMSELLSAQGDQRSLAEKTGLVIKLD